MAQTVLTKAELRRIIPRFIADEKRGISLDHFCEMAGMTRTYLYRIFVARDRDLTEIIQRRVSKAYQHWRAGDFVIMQRRDRTLYPDYRRDAKPRLAKGYGIELKDGRIQLKIGIRNRADYDPTIDEQLRRG